MNKSYLNPDETAKLLRDIGMKISATTVRKGLLQGRFLFGDSVKISEDGDEDSWVFWIYPVPLKQFILEKFGVDVDIGACIRKTSEEDHE